MLVASATVALIFPLQISAIPSETCPLPGSACRPDGPWPLTKCELLLNESACIKAHGTPQCNPKGCRTFRRCEWNGTVCSDPPPPPPPQPCTEISDPVDCVWSLGRDCRWDSNECKPVPPVEAVPLPKCAADNTCAHNGMSTTPPMGWRSWNLFAGRNDDATMRAMMHAFVDRSRMVEGAPASLADIGYLSVGMDDGYQLCNCSGSHGQLDHYPHSLYNVSCSGDNDGESANACRDGRCTWHNQTDGSPMIDTLKFPDLKGLVAYAHSLKLQVGFYLNNCICMEKGRTYFEQDVAFMHEMQFDTVKIDQCGSAMNMSLWAALINATGRPMMLENCHNAPSWWSPGPDAAKVCDSNMWRSGGDIGNGFGGAYSEAHQWFAKNNLSSGHPWGAEPISRPGCWGYPDMMCDRAYFVLVEIGNFCKDGPGQNPKCFQEERSHFGCFNMSNQDQMDRVWPIITNKEAIAIDHAWAGMPGTLYKTMSNFSIEVWAKALPDEKVAVLVLNAADTNTSLLLSAMKDVPGAPTSKTVRDVWNHKDIQIANDEISLTLGEHDSFFAVFSEVQDNEWWKPDLAESY